MKYGCDDIIIDVVEGEKYIYIVEGEKENKILNLN